MTRKNGKGGKKPGFEDVRVEGANGDEIVRREVMRKRPAKELTNQMKDINDESRVFWERRALKERLRTSTDPNLTREERIRIFRVGYRAIRERIRDERRMANEREIGRKQLEAAKISAREAKSEKETRALSFNTAVDELRRSHPKMAKTSAVKKTANRHGIAESTAWDYDSLRK